MILLVGPNSPNNKMGRRLLETGTQSSQEGSEAKDSISVRRTRIKMNRGRKNVLCVVHKGRSGVDGDKSFDPGIVIELLFAASKRS